jgi:hypothetical protein
MRSIFWASVGAAGMYFLDPDAGRGRRARVRQRAQAGIRRGRRETQRQERYLAGVKQGEQAREAGLGRYVPESYTDLREHVRGLIHATGASDVNVDVDDGGVITLRGEVRDPAMRADVLAAVAQAAESVPLEVIDLTFVAGETPPNKAAALEASRRASLSANDGQPRSAAGGQPPSSG